MKIMQVVESFGAGVYSFLVDLCNDLATENEVVIVYSQRKETPKEFKKDFASNIKFIELDMGLKNGVRSAIKLSKVINKEKPDVVHLHSSKAGYVGRIAKLLSNYNGKLFYNPHGLSFLRLDLPKWIRKILFLAEYFLSKFGGTVVAVSDSELNEVRKFNRNSLAINNGIKIEELEKELENLSFEKKYDEQLIVGTVGRIEFQKNPMLFNEIAKEFPDVKFVWIGDGNLKQELIENNIEVTGWLTRKEVLNRVAEFDIYIQTSLWEGLPISVLEALYLKKPIIVNNTIGNVDTVVKDKVICNGFVCNNKNDFLKAIYSLRNRDTRHDFGKNSFEHLKLNFNKKDSIEKYKKLYI